MLPACAALIRLFHYTELPLPFTMRQGAYSLSLFPNVGSNKQEGDRCLNKYFVSVGRVTSLHTIPVQNKWKDLQDIFSDSFDYSFVQNWLSKELQAINFQQVCCFDDDRQVEHYVTFSSMVLRSRKANPPMWPKLDIMTS